MKHSRKFLFAAAIALILFNSCSKDEADPTPKYTEKNMSIVLTYGGEFENFDETMGLQITGENANSTNIEGTEWTETHRPDRLASQFTRTGDVAGTVTLRTTKPVSSCTLVASYIPKDEVEITEPITVNVEYYIEDELVKTDNISTVGDGNHYQGIIAVEDYVK
ncbi:MAG: hypothetical protein M5Z89_05080 [Olivibacter sp.]|nr:hypothetical protein [Olivibacter sp. UJ_SKK_5.1]